ncbi:MAG: sigma-70 family RNA polymerase sigma factor [Clostridia bacterium]|nr:sigma-70 family RNA polymerase sigma factor [Clostridia bacterium]
MDDEKIVALFHARDEAAIAQVQEKYATYCRVIAQRILTSPEDVEECVNDAYRRAWETIPPEKPQLLSAYIGMLTRHIALNRARDNRAQKRGGGSLPLILDEMQECIPDGQGDAADDFILQDALNAFLGSLPQRTRMIFMRRYWYADSAAAIAADYRMKESSVNVLLFRTRKQLRAFLSEQGIYV